jgi:hypothetical protein
MSSTSAMSGTNGLVDAVRIHDMIHTYIYIIHIISICFQHILYIFYNYRSMFSWAKKRPWDLRVWRSVLDHWKSFAMEPFGWQWHPLHPVEVLVAGQKYQTSWLQVARLPETDLLGCSTLISIIYIYIIYMKIREVCQLH